MTGRDTDSYDDTPLLRALRAPGDDAELAREADYLRMFRTTVAPARRRGVWGRLGTGGTAVVTAIALSGGVAAAAYTDVLPEPAQRIVHDVLGRIGVPSGADEAVSDAGPARATMPDGSSGDVPAGATDEGDPDRSGPADDRSDGPTDTSTDPDPGSSDPEEPRPEQETAGPGDPMPTPGGPPSTGKPEDKPKPTPTGEPPRGDATDIAVTSAPPARVRVGTTVSLSGRLIDAEGRGVGGRLVVLQVRATGGGWMDRATGETGSSGAVSLSLRVEENVSVRLQAGPGLMSASTTIDAVPEVAAASSGDQVQVDVVGGHQGDRVVLYKLDGGSKVKLDQGVLDGSGRVTFDVSGKKGGAGDYVVELAATSRHAAAQRTLTVAS